MIRMGRGNRTDQPGSNDFPEQPAADPYRYATETQTATNRGAIPESDSMARDIKGRLSGLSDAHDADQRNGILRDAPSMAI